MRLFSGILLLMTFVFSSCSDHQDNIVIFKEFTNQEWGRFEYLSGDFNVNKPQQKYDVVMEIVVNDQYPNIYETYQEGCPFLFNMTIKNPDGNGNRSRDYKFTLKDQDGNWKADNKNGHYSFKLPVIGEMTFTEKGTYNFKIENKYPKDPLYGIKSLRIECIKSK